ncbi:hypothetical protein CHLRE_21g752997v5 [Chlamydomonas reinhardtii]|uniref:RNase H type-1 domain-containing protein n=1 Tax=Chlamydomonas reinhardtii TaxID=3055 RepID=A0A2K3CNB1_CHLRE|nr:uncharacterized protein CHLRE_21g752997v5 [Chlamydomonas reinhardtii]PNW69771.1 hypothetical protein CHLRE_21g752997v5 [Chlamydomonas reinhardtii]
MSLSQWWEQLEEEALQEEAQDVQARYAGQFVSQRTAGPPLGPSGPAKHQAAAAAGGRVAPVSAPPRGPGPILHRKQPSRPQPDPQGAEVVGFWEDNPGEVVGVASPAPQAPQQQPPPGQPQPAAAPPRMRGRLRARAPVWKAWIVNSLVLSWVLQGFPLIWEHNPPPPFSAGNHASAEKHAAFVDSSIADMLASNTIRKWVGTPHMVCPLGVVEQGEKLRLIWDGRAVNDYLHVPSFRYEDLRAVPNWLRKDDYVFTLNLKSGYITSTFGPTAGNQNAETLVARREIILAKLADLGFNVNLAKSMLGPPQHRFRYLGMLIDTSEGVFIVPDDKRSRVLDSIRGLLKTKRPSARALASVKGQLVSMTWAMGPWARLRTRALGQLIETRRSWESHLRLSEDARDELTWWLDSFDKFNGRRPLWPPVRVTSLIHCDAAGRSADGLGGWGAWTVLDGQLSAARGNWKPADSAMGSTPQELRAILLALQSFDGPAGLAGHAVCVLTDSLNASNVINKGSARADNSHAIACTLHGYCFERAINIRAEWIPREQNQIADHLSKLRDSDDWMVNPTQFKRLNKLWGPFDIDLFASHTNHQLPRYYSRFLTPDTSGVDAFRFAWGRRCWANPPFGIILKVLRHARECKARLCLIVPYWPTRDWWPEVTTDEGSRFCHFVHGVRMLGRASNLFLPGSTGNSLPKGAAELGLRARALLPGSHAADTECQALAAQLAEEAPLSRRPATHSQYGGPWRSFLAWCRRRAPPVPPYAASPQLVALYLQSVLNSATTDGSGPSRVDVAGKAIAFHYSLAGLPNPAAAESCANVRATAARRLQVQRLHREAMSAADLAAVLCNPVSPALWAPSKFALASTPQNQSGQKSD